MVGGICFLLLVSLVFEAVLKGFSQYVQAVLPGGLALALGAYWLFDLAFVILLFASIFKFLPDAKIRWRDVWIGATLTAFFFALGKWALGLYLGSGNAASAYGAASSLITLLLWVFYSAQILLFGAEFTQVYATRAGRGVQPDEHADFIAKPFLSVELAVKVLSWLFRRSHGVTTTTNHVPRRPVTTTARSKRYQAILEHCEEDSVHCLIVS
jgi:uncharacterized BrkB/YihY/UPF0761 family membrane protein